MNDPARRVASIRTTMMVVVVIGLVMLISASWWHNQQAQRELVDRLAREKMSDVVSSYFDGVNTMMLTGSMAQRDTLRNKFLEHPGVVDVRLLRGDAIIATFGEGLAHEQASNAGDQQALKGETLLEDWKEAGQRFMKLRSPIKASANYRGTNCLGCHPVPEDTVLGAVTVTYSLHELDQVVAKNTLGTSMVNAILFGGAFLVLAWVLNRLVLARLARMRDTMLAIELDSDLTHRFQVRRRDEVGQLGEALNGMLERFASGLGEVAQTSQELQNASERIASVAVQSADSATEQKAQTSTVATAITQLEAQPRRTVPLNPVQASPPQYCKASPMYLRIFAVPRK